MVDASQIAPEMLYRITRRDYDQMVELGIFAEKRIELLEGVLVKVSPQGAKHAEVIKRLNRFLSAALGDDADVLVQSPLAISGASEPEPDVALVPRAAYWKAHPTEAFLVIEVASSSLDKDRELKKRLYAEAGVPEYWVVNLVDTVIEVHCSPQGGAYQQALRYVPGDSFALVEFPKVTVHASDFLPGAP